VTGVQTCALPIYYQRAVITFPNLASAHTGLGSFYVSIRQCENAEKELQRSITIDPSLQAPYLALYLDYTHCMHNANKEKAITEEFEKLFQVPILDAINQSIENSN